jgi:hypothetical protein
MQTCRWTGVLAGALIVFWAAGASAQEREEETLVVGEQLTFEPGYAVGDIAIVDVKIADYRVERGRRSILLLGKTKGQTILNITDQKRVLRTILTITVQGREEADLQALLQDFPEVSIRRIGDKAVVTGTVSSKNDLETVQKMARVAGVESLVRVSYGGAADSGSASDGTAASGVPQVEYEIDVLEASVAFVSGSYGTGVEPSGPSLFKEVVRVPVGGEAEIYVPGKTVSDKARKKNAPESGIRMTLQPGDLSAEGAFTTFVTIETNVPVEESSDPSVMRRARWEMEVLPGEPFAVAGAQLLAVPAAVKSGGSKFGRALKTMGAIARMPGVRHTDVREYTTGIPYYDRKKKTQVLALFKPRVIGGAR